VRIILDLQNTQSERFLIALKNPTRNWVAKVEQPFTPGQAARITVVRENNYRRAAPDLQSAPKSGAARL
jgi:hypothetical protein